MNFNAYHKSLEVLHKNCLEPRAYFIPYSAPENAKKGDRNLSDCFLLLNGEWNFRFYNTFEDVEDDFLSLGFKEKIDVPRCWQTYTGRGYDAPLYSNLKYPFPLDPPNVPVDNPCGLYSRKVIIEKKPGKKYRLNFEGVSSCFYLFINNSFAAYSQVSHCTSEIDVSDYLVSGENKIDVLVVKWCDGTYLEDQDMFRLSGIFRDVYILERDAECIEDIYLRTDVSADLSLAEIKAEIKGKKDFTFELLAPDGKTVSKGNADVIKIKNPVLWNTENPKLYTLIIHSGNEFIPFRLALKKLEIRKNVAYFNNKPVKLYGINRHDSNPETGYYCDLEHMKRDLFILKQGNVNTIRTSHYPPSPLFMELCDEYGFMVCDEADIETHGMGFEYKDTWDWPRWSFLSRSDDWEEAYVDRAKRLFERDKNFGCVIMWSLGNESGCGKNHRRMREYIKSRDSKCIVHYENAHLEFKSVPNGENYSDISDVESRMYASLDYTEDYAKNREAKKPFFFCEFSCSMTTGDIHAHCDLFRKYPVIFGGCYWELTDHAVSIGKGKFRYGGDFGDYPNDDICCVDGVVFPDRALRPGFYDMKKGYEPFECKFENGNLTLFNRQYFENLKNVNLEVKLENRGRVIFSTVFENISVAPQSSQSFKIGAKIPKSDFLYLTVSLKLAKKTFWASKGYEIGFNQFDLSSKDVKKEAVKEPAPEIKEGARFAEITAGNVKYIFDKPYGTISGIEKEGKKLLADKILPEIWKAPGNNELGRANECKSAAMDCATLRTYDCKILKSKKAVKIECNCSIGGPMVVPVLGGKMTYTFFGDGSAEIRFSGELRELLREMNLRLPRFGFRFTMPSGNEKTEYLGKGPVECYADRHKSQRFGRFETTAGKNFVPYIFPLENGAHYGTVEGRVGDGKAGLCFEAVDGTAFLFNASHFTPGDLEKCAHNDELVPRKETFVYCDYKMDIRGGRGYYEDVEPERKWDYEPIDFAVKIKPY